MHVYIIAQVRQKTATTRQREPAESGLFCFPVFDSESHCFSTAFLLILTAFCRGNSPPKKKPPLPDGFVGQEGNV